MAVTDPYVAVVDDEAPVRTALGRLLRLEDYEVASFRKSGLHGHSDENVDSDC